MEATKTYNRTMDMGNYSRRFYSLFDLSYPHICNRDIYRILDMDLDKEIKMSGYYITIQRISRCLFPYVIY
jgi:hypothetical protein